MGLGSGFWGLVRSRFLLGFFFWVFFHSPLNDSLWPVIRCFLFDKSTWNKQMVSKKSKKKNRIFGEQNDKPGNDD